MNKRKRRSKGKRRKGEGLNDNGLETDVSDTEITLGWEKAGIGASITFSEKSVKVSLGIGIAAVELDLGELNNSTVTYAFDLYEIAGSRDGCYVYLEYSIAGTVVKSEARKIPDCEEEKEQEKTPEDNLEEEKASSGGRNRGNDTPSGNLWDEGVWLIGVQTNRNNCDLSDPPMVTARIEEEIVTGTGRLLWYDGRVVGAEVTWQEYLRVDRWYRPTSVSDYMVQREGYPTETQRSYTSSNVESYKLSQIRYWNAPVHPGWPMERLRLGGTVAHFRHWLNKQRIPNPDYYRDDKTASYFQFSEYANDGSYIKILDYHMFERKPPQRNGGNGVQSNKTKNKRRKSMDEKCCQMIAEIYDVLAVDEIINEGLEIPTELYVPKGQGDKKLENYLQILEYQIRIAAHLGIAPFHWKVKDSNLVKKGNQSLEGQTINGTDAIREILQNTMKTNSSNEASFTAIGSLMIALEQILSTVTEGTRTIREIFQFLSIPVKSQTFKLKLPFNTGALLKKNSPKKDGNKSKGFKPMVELNKTEKAESLLPKMLSQKEREYELEVYDDNYPDLIEQLTRLGININDNNK